MLGIDYYSQYNTVYPENLYLKKLV